MAPVADTTDPPLADALPALQAPVAAPLAHVEARLTALADTMPTPLAVVTRGLLTAGKRLRPLVLLLAAGEDAPKPEAPVILATAVEETHVASLIHDDVIDDSQRRRGRPSVPASVGQLSAVLAGDYLAAAAYQQVISAAVPDRNTSSAM